MYQECLNHPSRQQQSHRSPVSLALLPWQGGHNHRSVADVQQVLLITNVLLLMGHN